MATKQPTNEDLEVQAETKNQKGKWKLPLAFFLCFIFSVAASSATTYFLIPTETKQEITDQNQVTEETISDIQQKILSQGTKLSTLQAQNDVLKLYLRHSSATALKNILIDQENNIQAYLKVMKSAMNDMSRLIPGTTDWNNEYQYQLDLALKGSIEREDLLKLLKTGEPNDK